MNFDLNIREYLQDLHTGKGFVKLMFKRLQNNELKN